jgi:Ca-activated chloride channel family protein
MLTLTPGEDLNKSETGMDYVFLLDISGSMGADGKLLISKDSVNAFISALSPDDRFEVMTFNVQPNQAFKNLRAADAEGKQSAATYLQSQEARGGTVLNPALAAAFKYQDADRPLNVVILSDGLTEQNERATLISMSRSRKSNVRIFCIGIGNDVNRPMLEQVANEAGGLAAFISAQDNFSRQAEAFRRKLTRPAATALQFEIKNAEVYDIEPKKLPDLYHGSPVRVFGRYKSAGKASVEFRGSVNGREIKQSVPVEFPRQESANPEVERMWAWKRIDGILKEADASGSRSAVIPEIIRLGEGYQIVTEYTSFLVLENDAEYQRWKISRTNLRKSETDRLAQLAVNSQLEAIRNKALANIGPEAVAPASKAPAPMQVSSASGNSMDLNLGNSQPAPASSRRGFNLGGGGGSGPVGPIFLLVIGGVGLFARARRKICSPTD